MEIRSTSYDESGSYYLLVALIHLLAPYMLLLCIASARLNVQAQLFDDFGHGSLKRGAQFQIDGIKELEGGLSQLTESRRRKRRSMHCVDSCAIQLLMPPEPTLLHSPFLICVRAMGRIPVAIDVDFSLIGLCEFKSNAHMIL